MKRSSLELQLGITLFIIAALCFIIHFLFFRHSFPPVNIDEASFFSPAYSLASTGVLSSNVHQSFLPGSAEYTYWMPPLYLVSLGGVFKIFGATVFTAKMFNLILSISSAYIITTLTADRYNKLVGASLFLICPFIIITSTFIRVEALALLIMVMAIASVNFKFKEHWLGIIAGLGVMTHPLLLPAAVGLGIVAIRRGWKPFIIFSIAALLTPIPHFIYIFQDIDLYKDQMALQLARKAKASFSDLKLSYLIQSVPFALLALWCLVKVKHAFEVRLFLAISIVLSMLIILRSNEFNYQVYIIPYVIASVLLTLNQYNSKHVRVWLPLGLFIIFSGLLFSKLFKYHLRTDAEYKQLISYLQKHKQWEGANIFVAGSPDVATFFLAEGQNVERQIPISIEKEDDWFAKYNYVAELTDNLDPSGNATEKPWKDWTRDTAFTTSEGSHTMFIYSRK